MEVIDPIRERILERVPKIPITLSTVLRAIGNMMVVVDAEGNFYRLKMSLNRKLPSFDTDAGTAKWDLSVDDYDYQTHEVKAFIGKTFEI